MGIHYKVVNIHTHGIELSYVWEPDEIFGGSEPAPSARHLRVPDNMDPDCVKVIVQVDGSYALAVDEDLVAAKALAAVQAAVSAEYASMCADIYGKMNDVFSTSNPESASAYYPTWLLMVANPSRFSGERFTAVKASGAFAEGDVLATDNDVVSYAGALIEEANEYSIYRLKRLRQFKNARQIITGGAL